MLKVGIVGFSYMGRMHFRGYEASGEAEVIGICDLEENKFDPDWGTVENVKKIEGPFDLCGIELFTNFDRMLEKLEFDAVSVTLPTFLHRDFTVKSLEAGINVMCEKPMALNQAQCEDMVAAAEKSGKVLQVGQCLRFWPEYVKAKELIESGDYGKLKVITLRRLSRTPIWSWDNWFLSGSKSGGAALDLHIHDADYVQFLFGMPKAVHSQGVKGPSGDYDHISTQYIYEDEKIVIAEGGWMMMPGFGFEMSFNIVLEKATISFDSSRDPTFRIFLAEDKQSFIPELEEGNAYNEQFSHFLKVVNGQEVPEILTPAQALDSVKLVIAEKLSAETRKAVEIK